jgi:hypothetical protein
MKQVMTDVENERRRQDARWGNPDTPHQRYRRVGGENTEQHRKDRDEVREAVQALSEKGTETWMDLLWEEMMELSAEPDDDWEAQRREAIQLAATAIAMVQAVEGRREAAQRGVQVNPVIDELASKMKRERSGSQETKDTSGVGAGEG